MNADTATPGFSPPLLLAGGYALAGFTADLADLRTMFATLATAENDLKLARKQRDALLTPARARMVQYRTLVEATFGETHPLTLSLPTLSPNPGSTPDAVILSGEWDDATQLAVLSWTPSDNSNLQVYQLRGTIGPVYDEATSQLVGNHAPGTLSVPTLFGLESAGDSVTFKVIVILSTGNQASSNAVTITQP